MKIQFPQRFSIPWKGPGQDFMDQYYQYSVEQLRSSGRPPEVIEREIAEMEAFVEMYHNPLVRIGITLLEIFPVALIISLISAAILRKK